VKTDDLVRQLASEGGAVRRLHGPWTRAALWLSLCLPYVAVVVLLHPPAGDIWAGLFASRFLIEEFAALLTAVTAAAATFASTVPGYDRRILLLPIAPLALWLGTVGLGCIADWVKLGPEGLALRPDWECLPPAILLGIVPIAVIVVMLRRGAPLSPRITLLLGAVAVAALGNAALRLFHVGDASIMILVWHVGTALLLAALVGLLGNRVFGWRRAPQS
jgi:hypothetical protein